MPKMTHPDSRATVEVAADQVPNYESQGWQVNRPASKKSGAKSTTPTSESE